MPYLPEDNEWKPLLTRIADGRCTPFLGAGACYPFLPLGSEIARELAKKYEYPFDDYYDLARVAQFIAVETDNLWPKEKVIELLKKRVELTPPDFKVYNEIHGVLADLPLPVYITTNYDDFMMQALESRGKAPRQLLCQWSEQIKQFIPSFSDLDLSPTPEKPIVFYLHGFYKIPESLVLTEDDYEEFLASMDINLLPYSIQKALTSTSLLYLGYRLADWDFRVFFRRHIMSSIVRSHWSVQIMPGVTDEQKRKAVKYLDHYFGKKAIKIYWGTCSEFAGELREKWEEFKR